MFYFLSVFVFVPMWGMVSGPCGLAGVVVLARWVLLLSIYGGSGACVCSVVVSNL